MKNVSRNKFLLCFRPVVDMDLMLESEAVVVDRSQKHQALTYVGVKNKEDMKPSGTKSSVSDTKNSIMIHRPEKKTFSQVFKAVVFEIILARRVSSKQNFSLSSRDKLLDTSSDKSVNKVLAGKGIQDATSKANSSSSSSSSSSKSTQKTKRQQLQNNCNTYSGHQEGEIKPKQGVERGSRSNSAIYLLLTSLALTIFWGKFCAILFTSIWLYFLPYQQPAGVIGNLENIRRNPEKKSRDFKKKVRLEGLLEKNHNRGALNF